MLHLARGELTRALGVEWTPVRQGIAGVDGIPSRVLRAFSRRRRQIEAALDERGLDGPRASEAAALATRRAKRTIAPTMLVDGWRARAALHGLTPARVARLLGPPRERMLGSREWDTVIDELAGPAGLTATRTSFTRRDVIIELCDRLPAAAVTTEQIERAADLLLASELVVPLRRRARPG
jgi:TrwC relaxase